jgi:hypothetical protein
MLILMTSPGPVHEAIARVDYQVAPSLGVTMFSDAECDS